MRTHIRLGRLLGVPIGLNWGVLAVCVLLTVSLASDLAADDRPGSPRRARTGSPAWWACVGFLVSLTGHELGHSYIADRNDVRVVEITLWLFGGVAKLEGDADNPGAEFRIAAAGPAMSMVMAGLFGGGVVARGPPGRLARCSSALLLWLALINVVLAVSNLLPAFPLDGGRMLRAILWRRSRRKLAATRTAALWGQILAGVVVIVASLAIMHWGVAVVRAFWFAAAGRCSSCRRGPIGVAQRSRRSPELMQCPRVAAWAARCPSRWGGPRPSPTWSGPSPAHPGTPLVPVYDEHGQVSALVLPGRRHAHPSGAALASCRSRR